MSNLAKTVAVVVSSTILATASLHAVDVGSYLSEHMLSSVFFSKDIYKEEKSCPEHMVLVTQALNPFCIDAYEASTGVGCTYKNPQNEDETMLNLTDTSCIPESKPHAMPWTHISVTQAQQACSRAGKRLPHAGEWYKAALGTSDIHTGWTEEHCNVANNRASGVDITGSGIRCISDVGAYDMVGNVWEWVNETIQKGNWNGRVLPETGFVSGADIFGVAFETKSSKQERYASDRFWSDKKITAGMMRGGFYNSTGQAGVFATYTASPPTFTGNAVGFRCVTSSNQ